MLICHLTYCSAMITSVGNSPLSSACVYMHSKPRQLILNNLVPADEHIIIRIQLGSPVKKYCYLLLKRKISYPIN